MAHATSKAGKAGGCYAGWDKPITEGQMPNDITSPKAAATIRQLQTEVKSCLPGLGEWRNMALHFGDRTLLCSPDWLGTGNSLPPLPSEFWDCRHVHHTQLSGYFLVCVDSQLCTMKAFLRLLAQQCKRCKSRNGEAGWVRGALLHFHHLGSEGRKIRSLSKPWLQSKFRVNLSYTRPCLNSAPFPQMVKGVKSVS